MWTINRLRDIARLTGWETALAVTVGLETTWNKAAELGTGPPYIRAEYPVWTNNRGAFGSQGEAQVNIDRSVSNINENFEHLGVGDGSREAAQLWMPNGIL